ncbi:MAG: DUF2130 domain-containing protein, partial [Acidimicrobiia bacterium]
MSPSRTIDMHEAHGADAERCPWCDQPISQKKFEQIRRRIQAEEGRRSKALAAEAKAEIDKARREAAVAMAEAKQAAALRVKAALESGKRAAQKELKLELSEARNAKVAAEKALSLEKDRQDKALRARLAEQREVLERDKEKAVKTEQARAFTDRQKIEERLQSVQRQLQKRTAEELGEGAEIDLFEALKEAFPTDQIKRVKHGEPGADIIHTVRDKSRACGLIVYDSKNRTAWRNEYARKLRDDQLAAKADYAILACRAFPTGARQLSAQDGVVLANPARVVVLAGILRDHVVQIA